MPTDDYFAGASTQQVIQTPGAIAADSNTAGVDIKDFKGECMAVLSAIKTAGTNPTMDVKLQSAPDGDVIITESYTGTGNGTLTELEGGPDSVAEDITIHMDSETGFTVTGTVTGAIGTGTVGTKFTSQQINFLITAGTVAFIHTDEWTVHTHARTYVDITGAAFTQVTTTGSIQRKAVNIDQAGRFLRANYDIGGTVGPSYIIGVALYGMQL